jgi:hypothetical protein
MLKKLLRDLAKRIREAVPFDPKQYDDPIAAQTKWTPARRGGSSFCTRKLIQKSFHRYKFRPAIGAIIFYLIFLIIGLGLLAASLKAPFLPESIKMNDGSPITLIIGGVFALIGAGMFYFGTKPIIFDKQQGYFYKGRHAPSVTSYNVRGKNHISLNQIHAIQLISEFCRGSPGRQPDECRGSWQTQPHSKGRPEAGGISRRSPLGCHIIRIIVFLSEAKNPLELALHY